MGHDWPWRSSSIQSPSIHINREYFSYSFVSSDSSFKSCSLKSLDLPKSAMADQFSAYEQFAEEEYIDMDIRSSPKIFCYRIPSPNDTELGFHLSNQAREETRASIADELYYRGNHLPRPMRMEEKLLRDSENEKWWSKKLKGIGQSLLKLKISKANFMSIITMKKEAGWDRRRSVSSVVLRNHASKSASATSLSSTSSSSFSSVSRSSHVLKRSSSMSSEMESSVMGAIAYCKKSQQIYGRKEECR